MAMLFVLMCMVADDSVQFVQSTWAWSSEACGSSITVQQSRWFEAGDHVLIHRPTCDHEGDRLSHNVGEWSWNVIDTIIGQRIYLTHSLQEPLSRARHLQIIRAVTPDDKRLRRRIVSRPWNGLHGGVVALWSDDTVHIESPISATSTGFYQPTFDWNSSDTTARFDEQPTAVLPGDGMGPCSVPLVSIDSLSSWGRGGLSGRAHNSGGAGGASAGRGGNGGSTSSAFSPINSMQGASARPLDDGTRLVFGSSGGGGHGNDLDGGRGGRGGGIIVIRARHIQFHTGSIVSADGTNGHDASHDGSGGGGAGGMVLLDAESVSGDGLITARGGHGGTSRSTLFLCGPGGGGAGGSVMSTSALPASVRCIVSGGAAGASSAISSDSTADRGATSGGDGTSIHPIARWKPPTAGIPRVRLRQADTMVAFGSTTLLWTEGATATQWLDNVRTLGRDSVSTPPIERGRWFRARMTRADGCVILDSVYVRPSPQARTLVASIGDAHARPGDTVDVYLSVRATFAPQRTIEGIVYVSTHSYVLLPITSSGYVSGTRTHIKFPFRLGATAASTYRRDQLRAALGDSASVQFRIDSVIVNDSSITVQKRPGRFTLDDLCATDGRVRLFSPQIDVAFRGRTITTSANELFISDVLGRILAHHSANDSKGLVVTLDPTLRGLIFIAVVDGEYMRTVPWWISAD
ncbi:MAG: hypothetical protein FGM32_01845 [Candidatus Kapabacteria bacterium]|nr:hypothetical protein [Candidatus Kapabacteria bacterium]